MDWQDERAASLAMGLTAADREQLDRNLQMLRDGDGNSTAVPPAGTGGRWLNVRPDPIDFRDFTYRPGLLALKGRMLPDEALLGDVAIRDQEKSKACTGMALAHAVDLLRWRRFVADGAHLAARPKPVSARMIYEMAKAFDEFPEDGLRGSSLRGALRGLFHNGVCEAEDGDDDFMPPPWLLSVDRAKNARAVSLGVFMRVRHILLDYHCALNEIGALVVSGRIHDGWQNVSEGEIPWRGDEQNLGLHAFVLVGYDDEGFLVCNSWGSRWGGWSDPGGQHWPGIARWTYDDWQRNAVDAWAIRLAVSPSRFFNALGGLNTRPGQFDAATAATPPRIAVNGHYLHIKDGRLFASGVFNSDPNSVEETGRLLARHPDYRHLAIIVESGLESLDVMVQRMAVLIPFAKAAKIYPVFVLWREDAFRIASELLDDRSARLEARTGGFETLREVLLERFALEFLPPVWRTFEGEVERSFTTQDLTRGQAWPAIKELLEGARDREDPLSVHFVANGAGAIWLVALLERLAQAGDLWQAQGNTASLRREAVATIDLLAPVCRKERLEAALAGLWGGGVRRLPRDAPEPLALYTLREEEELADRVGAYRGSFLQLARRVFPIDGEQPATVAGHATVAAELAAGRKDRVHYQVVRPTPHNGASRRQKAAIRSRQLAADCRTHRGMANDVDVLQKILERILRSGNATGTLAFDLPQSAMPKLDTPSRPNLAQA